MGHILLIEDDPAIADSLALVLQTRYGHVLHHASTLDAAWETWRAQPVDAVLLDLTLPDGDGIEFCRAIREREDPVPILIISARRDEVDRILGLELGADDYIVKPFSPREVCARLHAVLRRQQWAREPDRPLLSHGGLTMDVAGREVLVRGRHVTLTKLEFELLRTLLVRPRQVHTRAQLLEAVWQGAYLLDRVVDAAVSRLRRKLGPRPGGGSWIETVRGVGYRLAADPEDGAPSARPARAPAVPTDS